MLWIYWSLPHIYRLYGLFAFSLEWTIITWLGIIDTFNVIPVFCIRWLCHCCYFPEESWLSSYILLACHLLKLIYNDSWDLYDVVFDQEHRKYDFISIIEEIESNNNSKNNSMLMTFCYLYVLFVPIICYIGYTTLCLVLRCNRTQIRRIILILLLYSFLCCNGLDMFLCTTLIFKYVLPAIWQSIMNTIYLDFCSELVPIGNNANFCDHLTVEVALETVMFVATALILILFGIFCMVNDAFKCLKHDDSPYYLRDQTSTWDYM